jgi:hypothetical protein
MAFKINATSKRNFQPLQAVASSISTLSASQCCGIQVHLFNADRIRAMIWAQTVSGRVCQLATT